MSSKFNQMKQTDEEQVRKAVPMPIQKAKVIQTPDHGHGDGDGRGYHQVYVKLYYDDSQERATVLTGKQGDVSIPEEGDDVYVMFGASDKPLVLGSFYPVDDEYGDPNLESVPEYEAGDRIIGNNSGSYMAIRDDGTIEIITDEYKPVNIDRQSAFAHLTTSQVIPGDDAYYKVEYDLEEDDFEDLFDPTTHDMTVRHDGAYEIDATVAFDSPGQSNRYTLAVYVNGTQEKRKSRQSTNNRELSLDVSADLRLDAGDVVDIRIRQNSGADKALVGSEQTSDFTIERRGI